MCFFRNSGTLTIFSFSALQRAENSSMLENSVFPAMRRMRFSALQRAENSSIVGVGLWSEQLDPFQCSSASRKFLNYSKQETEQRAD